MQMSVEEVRPWYDVAVRVWVNAVFADGKFTEEVAILGLTVTVLTETETAAANLQWKRMRVVADEWSLDMLPQDIDPDNEFTRGVSVSGEGDEKAFRRDTVYLTLSKD